MSSPNIKIPICNLGPDVMVSELIDQDLHCWNNNLVRSFFEPSEALNVIRIPLFFKQPEDKIICYHEMSGEYSVRSSYQFLSINRSNLKHGASIATKDKLWKKV